MRALHTRIGQSCIRQLATVRTFTVATGDNDLLLRQKSDPRMKGLKLDGLGLLFQTSVRQQIKVLEILVS